MDEQTSVKDINCNDGKVTDKYCAVDLPFYGRQIRRSAAYHSYQEFWWQAFLYYLLPAATKLWLR